MPDSRTGLGRLYQLVPRSLPGIVVKIKAGLQLMHLCSLLQRYLSDFLNLYFPPEQPQGLLALVDAGCYLGYVGGIGCLRSH